MREKRSGSKGISHRGFLKGAGVVAGNWLGLGCGWFGSEMSFTAFSGYGAGKNAAEYSLKKA